MSYNTWVTRNLEQLTINYKSRYKFIYKTSFQEFCDYIYTGIKNGCVLPKEYIKNLK